MTKERYDAANRRLALYARALGHPARIAIMEFLARREQCYFGAIHEELPISKATVSQHLKALRAAGLIQGEVEAPKVKYCIDRRAWDEARALFGSFFSQCLCKDDNCCE